MNDLSEQVQGLAGVYGRGAHAYARTIDPTLEPMACHAIEIAGVSASDSVLDLATGTGVVARAAARRGARVVAVDLSGGMLAVARRPSPRSVDYVRAEASLLPFAGQAFDAIACGLSISHFTDVRAVLTEGE